MGNANSTIKRKSTEHGGEITILLSIKNFKKDLSLISIISPAALAHFHVLYASASSISTTMTFALHNKEGEMWDPHPFIG